MTMSAFTDELASVRTHKKEFLAQIERIVPWGEWIALIKPHYYKGERGNKPYDLERMLRIYLIQNLYDLPEQLSVLMSYDMGKIGFIQDLVRGIDKVMGKKQEAAPAPAQVVQTVVQSANGVTTDSLLKRGNLFLEDKDWQSADE